MANPLEHRTTKTVTKGTHYPLGATLTADGVNFAVYSQQATDVFLLLFDKADGDPTDVIRLPERDKFIWHAHVKGVKAGQLYGYKVRGEYRPEFGLRFNDAKLLIDPYAKAVTGKFRNTDNLLLAYDPRARRGRRRPGSARQHDSSFPSRSSSTTTRSTGRGRHHRISPLQQLVIYEVHVKGFTAHPSSGARHAGTYLGFIDKIPHLKKLGINAVELLPVHEFYVDDFLTQKGLTNYWGYNSIGFFAPESSYSTGRDAGLSGRGVQDAGPRAPQGRHQGDPRRRLQPHRRGERDGSEPVFPRHRQHVVLQPHRTDRRAAPLLHELHGLRQQPELQQPARSFAW